MYNPKTKNRMIKDLTFLNESYGEWSKVDKPMLVSMNYEVSNGNKAVKIVLAHNENNDNCYNLVSNSESDKESKENFLEGQVEDELEVTPKTTLNPKVVYAIKNYKLCITKMLIKLWNKCLKKKVQKKNIFFIDLATIARVDKDTKFT